MYLNGSVENTFDGLLAELLVGVDFCQRLGDPHQKPPDNNNLKNGIKLNVLK